MAILMLEPFMRYGLMQELRSFLGVDTVFINRDGIQSEPPEYAVTVDVAHIQLPEIDIRRPGSTFMHIFNGHFLYNIMELEGDPHTVLVDDFRLYRQAVLGP